MIDQKRVYASKMYCHHGEPFAYATCTNFGSKRGLIQIQSDWGVYSAYFGSMGSETIEEFVLNSSQSYLTDKLESQMRYMGMKKESFTKLHKFMIECWPQLRGVIQEEFKNA